MTTFKGDLDISKDFFSNAISNDQSNSYVEGINSNKAELPDFG